MINKVSGKVSYAVLNLRRPVWHRRRSLPAPLRWAAMLLKSGSAMDSLGALRERSDLTSLIHSARVLVPGTRMTRCLAQHLWMHNQSLKARGLLTQRKFTRRIEH